MAVASLSPRTETGAGRTSSCWIVRASASRRSPERSKRPDRCGVLTGRRSPTRETSCAKTIRWSSCRASRTTGFARFGPSPRTEGSPPFSGRRSRSSRCSICRMAGSRGVSPSAIPAAACSSRSSRRESKRVSRMDRRVCSSRSAAIRDVWCRGPKAMACTSAAEAASSGCRSARTRRRLQVRAFRISRRASHSRATAVRSSSATADRSGARHCRQVLLSASHLRRR